MSDEKIDLAEIATDAARMVALFGPTATYRGKAVEMLALVRVARAAIVVAADPLSTDAVRRLDAALALFADSAEDK